MATTVICDVCETAPALGKVRVTIELENAIPGSTLTGRAEELDCCETCQPAALSQLADRAREALSAHVPAQRELLELKEQILALRKQREGHQNLIGTLEFAAEQLAKEQEAAGAEFTDLAKRPNAPEGKTTEAAERLAVLNSRGAQFTERIAIHHQAVADIDVQLDPLLRRRTELHEATK